MARLLPVCASISLFLPLKLPIMANSRTPAIDSATQGGPVIRQQRRRRRLRYDKTSYYYINSILKQFGLLRLYGLPVYYLSMHIHCMYLGIEIGLVDLVLFTYNRHCCCEEDLSSNHRVIINNALGASGDLDLALRRTPMYIHYSAQTTV